MTRSSLGRTWHIVAFVVAVIALVLQLILILLGQNILDSSSVTSGLPEQVRRYFSYFTIQANFLVAISMFMLVTGRTGTQLFRVLRLASLIGATRSPRVYAAGGHGMWGITLGPATGRLLADQMVSGRTPVELAPFSPTR